MTAGGLSLVLSGHARALARARSEFAASISHEMRTPLTLIRGVAETLELGHVRGEEERAEYLRVLGGECDRLASMIGNVLDLARQERGAPTASRRPVDPAEIVRRVDRTLGERLRREGFDVRLVLDPSVPAVHGEAEALERALANLLDNAARYSGDSRWIEVALRTGPGRVLLSVRDGGIGIAASECEAIFRPFERGATALARGIPGTGLGLAIVAGVARRHGGSVRVESEPDQGTTFVLDLPGSP